MRGYEGKEKKEDGARGGSIKKWKRELDVGGERETVGREGVERERGKKIGGEGKRKKKSSLKKELR